MGGLSPRHLLWTGVGPVAAALRRALPADPTWDEAADPLDADVFLVAGPVGPKLAAAAREVADALPQDVETVVVETPPPGRDVDTIVAAGRPFVPEAPSEDPIPRLVEPTGRADLATEDLVISFGPIHPALATPLRLVLALDGEQVRDVIRDPGYAGRPGAAGDPDAPVAARVARELLDTDRLERPFERVAELERERAVHHLLAASRHLRLLGMAPRARALARLAEEAGRRPPAGLGELAPDVAAEVRGGLRRLGPALRMRGVGVAGPELVNRHHAGGIVARAAGIRLDARASGTLAPLYEDVGFRTAAGPASGDDESRFRWRLLEAAQSLELAGCAACRRPSQPFAPGMRGEVVLETPRGLLRIGEGTAMRPSTALLALLPELLVGARYADALVIVDGLDASAEEAET